MLKVLTTLVVCCLWSNFTLAQQLMIHKEFCKKQDVELIAEQELPKNIVVVGVHQLIEKKKVSSINELSPKSIRQIKRYAKMFRSCKGFVDFSGSLMKLYDKSHTNVNDYSLVVYFLVPAYPIARVTNY